MVHRAPPKPHKDVSDLLDAGGSLADLRRTRPKAPGTPSPGAQRVVQAAGEPLPAALRLLLDREGASAKRTANGWQVRCPAHEDRGPSLSVATGDDVPVVLHCHAGCTVGEIAAALGVSPAEFSRALPTDEFRRDVERERRRIEVREEARRLIASDRPRPPLPTGTLADALAEPSTEAEWTVDGLLPFGGNAVVVALAKSGKTTLAMNLAKSFADGDAFLGRFPVRPLDGRLLYLDYELSRRQELSWFRGIGIEQTERVVPWSLRGESFQFWLPEVRDEAAALCREQEIEVVVVDPWARAARPLVEEENSNSQGAAWTDALDAFKKSAGIRDAVVVTHTGKATYEDGEERARGAQRLEDWMDVGWYLTKDRASGRRSFRAMGRDVDLDAIDLAYSPGNRALLATGKTRAEARSEEGARRAVQAVAAVGEGASSTKVIEAMTGTKENRQRWLDSAEREGYIERRENGQTKQCFLTAKGLALLIAQGAHLLQVKEWLGHASVTTTEQYAHLAPDRNADLAARLGVASQTC
ncbi:AAA family ATPase [Patulibacter brassicae]|uniref:AAA family ATPase n=1 Tax=Patulibacter brassicae TaxID=1705717 RepID=A0ABU4VPI1_9ACTN|nr:AAA family ATPase [Patulibacter brassicae]MDX8152763.1 AAA family ATPase [Patulibacter brassicae]